MLVCCFSSFYFSECKSDLYFKLEFEKYKSDFQHLHKQFYYKEEKFIFAL